MLIEIQAELLRRDTSRVEDSRRSRSRPHGAPRARAVLVLAVALAAAGCATRRLPARGASGHFAVYRATYHQPESAARGFRLWLWAELPDRIHAEVLPPLGGPALIIDGGNGRLAITAPRRGVAWAGAASPEVLGTVLGFPVSLGELVASLLEGRSFGGGVHARRAPARGPGLPQHYEIESGRRVLELERRGRRRRGAVAELGTGTPPEGMEVRPLEDLTAGETPLFVPEAE